MGRKRRILWVLVGLTLAFIFGQSLLDCETSKKESSAVQNQVVEPVYRAITGETAKKLTDETVRDAAHMIEFAILGFEAALLLRHKNQICRGLKAVSYCGFAGLLDESIQFFSDRTPQVVDLWHDILGAFLGTVLALAFCAVIQKRLRKKGKS